MRDAQYDLERRINRLENMTARLPLRIPTVSPGTGGTVEVNIYRAVLTAEFDLEPAEWILAANSSEKHTLIPGEGFAYKLLPDETGELDPDGVNLFLADAATPVLNYFTQAVAVPDPGLAIIGWFWNDALFALDCNYIPWSAP